ncbi:MAG: RidA family protein [Myxococcota bacterium]
MAIHRDVQPQGWARPRGYANGVLAEGKLLFIAGQVGWDPATPEPTFPKSFVEQFDRALQNVLAVVREAGGTAENLTQLTLFVTDKAEYLAALEEVGAVWKKHAGRHYPAMALVQVASLLSDEAKVEIQGMAVL